MTASSPYLLIASRDPFTHLCAQRCYALAAALAAEGARVTLFLVQNGVLAARLGPGSGPLSRLSSQGVRVLADDFSLAERGIEPVELAPGVSDAPLGAVIDALEAGARVLWH